MHRLHTELREEPARSEEKEHTQREIKLKEELMEEPLQRKGSKSRYLNFFLEKIGQVQLKKV